ncbi:MAG: amidase [Moraxellaceae bacterium]|nr:amidase [Moraxellaceae bacterium]
MSDILTASATALAAKIRRRECTSEQVVAAHIERIRQVNPVINAVVQQRFEAALQEARQADERAWLSPDGLPPLHGVPCTIKENFAFQGYPQVSGLVSRRHAVADSFAPTVRRLRDAGAIVLGFSNTPELCMWLETHNRVYGRTANPYNSRHIAGGSSGGEGAIVGAGGSPFGLGADVGGSIRFPAFFNGVFGHKPTPGIVPNTGQVPLPEGAMGRNCVTGPIARRAEDLWPLLTILAGPDGVDPVCEAGKLVGDPATVRLADLHILTMADNGRQRVSPELQAVQRQAATWLGSQSRGLGTLHEPRLRYAFEIWSALMHQARSQPFAEQLGQGRRIPVGREMLKWLGGQSPHTLPALILAAVERVPMPHGRFARMGDELRDDLIATIGSQGVLLCPSYTSAAPRHNVPMLRPFDFAYSGIFNVLGFPVTQVPMGFSRQGLPLGFQVVGIPGNDAVTIAVAQALERQFGGWTPPFSSFPGADRLKKTGVIA